MKRPLAELPPLSEQPTVSVVIPARDAADTLEAAVASALRQGVPVDVIIAVVDAPTRAVAERLAASDPRVRVVDNPVGTAPAGLNAAIGESHGQVVVRLDAHAELEPGYIPTAIEVLRETGAANVGGRQVPVGDTGVAKAIALAMASPLGSGGARYRVGGPPGDVETVYLGVFRREALDHVGGFDETLVRNQDYMLNHRLRRDGGRVYFHPDLGVRYRPRPTLGSLARQYAEYGAWKRYVLRRHPGSLHPRQLAAPVLVLGLLGGLSLGLLTGWWWPLGALVGVYLLVLLVGAIAATSRGAAAPGPAGEAASAPLGEQAAGPLGAAASGPAGEAASGPVGEAASGPAVEADSGPVGEAASRPAGEDTSRPVGEAASGPAGEGTSTASRLDPTSSPGRTSSAPPRGRGAPARLLLAPAVAAALATMHLAWGLGFLAGRSGGPRRSSGATMGPHAVDG